ncbi:MAG TPA: hypothetical protein VF607_11450, partial [Verrucomicrobiae bacterium]
NGIKLNGNIEFHDDEGVNQFQFTQHYTIDQAWIKSENDGRYHCSFYPYMMATPLRKPADLQRLCPFQVTYPQHLILRTEITLPKGVEFTYTKTDKEVTDNAFTYRKTSSRHGSETLILEYGYQSMAEVVPANRMAEYLYNVDQVSKSLGDGFSWR